MKTIDFKTLKNNPCNGGIQYHFKAKNGYGASIVQHSFSYGNERGLWELAVIGKDGDICYTTPITDDVLGYLTEAEVDETLIKISKLPKAQLTNTKMFATTHLTDILDNGI